MRRILCIAVVMLLISQVGWSDDRNAAKELLVTNIESALSTLQRKDLVQQEKNKQVTAIVEPLFDFNLMAKLALGRKYWPELSEKNREKFVDLFVARLKATYVDKLSLYTNERVIYGSPVQNGRKIQIPTKVISKSKNYSMLYKLYKSPKGYKIYDIEIEGVSLISTYRSQFYDILSKGTIDDLLLKLEKPENK
ncbi:MAG: ABC transporter substrate-binding protein [Desulfobacterales bacterium]